MISTAVLSLSVMGQVVLPGSKLSLEDAQRKASVIVVAEVAQGGDALGSAGWFAAGIRLNVKSVLKGDPDLKELNDVSAQGSGEEAIPKKGDRYIYFTYDYRGHPAIMKVASETRDNLETLKKQ
jgi:hypothetical protein